MREEISKKELEAITQNKTLRQRLAYEDPLWFFLTYMRKHIQYELAPFHHDMFKLLRNPNNKLITTMAFRESGKSTIMNTTNVLWSILGARQSKFVVIVSQTQEQAKNHFANIKEELEHNPLLKDDFGPFHETEAIWNKLSLELEYHGSKIMCVSREQGLRGFKYGANRPDLIICDDLEDSSSFNDGTISEGVYNRFVSEILPLGGSNTRIVVLGNLISKDSLLMKLKEQIEQKKLDGVFRAYPLLDDNNKIMWSGKFKTMADIEKLKKIIPDEAIFNREYLLITGKTLVIYIIKHRDPSEKIETHKPERKRRLKKEKADRTHAGLPGYHISVPIVHEANLKTVVID